MISFQKEPATEFIKEGQDLFKMHAEEALAYSDTFPLAPNYEQYLALEKANKIELHTVRNNGVLVGYYTWMLTKHLHYKTNLLAVSTLVYIHPDHRKGMTGYKFIKWSIEEIKKRKPNRILITVKPHNDFGKLLERIGASYFEKTYAIDLE